MKTSLTITCLALLSACLTWGAPITITDPFPGNSCSNSSCDVIGDPLKFDIQKAVLDTSADTFTLYFNFGNGNSNINSFNIGGPTLYAGDLLFAVNGTFEYGIALQSHAGSGNSGGVSTGSTVTAGHLYQINNTANGLLTSNQVMGTTGSIYRTGVDVWLHNYNGALTDLASGSVNVVGGGNGNPNPEFVVTLSFPNLPSGFLSDFNSGNTSISFASATCANDIITGNIPGVPEPATMALMGGGLLALGVIRRKTRV